MTPPRPTAPTAAARSAADLQREMVECLQVDIGARWSASYAEDIAALVASVQAETLELAATAMDNEAGWCVGGKRASDVIRALMSKRPAPAYLECPVCGNDGMASTGYMDSEGYEQPRPSPLTVPSWTEDDEGPCISCGVALRVTIDDDHEAQLVEVSK